MFLTILHTFSFLFQKHLIVQVVKINEYIFILTTFFSLNCSAEITIFTENSFLQPLNCICYFCTCLSRVVRALIL